MSRGSCRGHPPAYGTYGDRPRQTLAVVQQRQRGYHHQRVDGDRQRVRHLRPLPDRECHVARPASTSSDGDSSGFSAADTAFLRARDRTCRGPHSCHAPASGCDLDHTIAKVDGGGHHRGNGGPLCRRCHIYKHQSGATLRQPEPGVFQWTTPLGHEYVVRPEPYDESTGPPQPYDIARQRLARLFALAA